MASYLIKIRAKSLPRIPIRHPPRSHAFRCVTVQCCPEFSHVIGFGQWNAIERMDTLVLSLDFKRLYAFWVTFLCF